MTKLVRENALIGGHRIAYGVHGEGEPVVLVHGTPSFSHIWRKVLPQLVNAGRKVFLYDLLGYGHSERPHDPGVDTSVSGQVPVLTGLLDFWGLEKPDIVAHDIGGGVAMRTSVFHPERVRSLTLIDSVSFDSWPSKRTREQMDAGLENLISASDSAHRKYFADWLLSAVHKKDQLSAGALQTYVGMISGPVGQASLFQHQIMHYNHKHTSELTSRLGELGDMRVQLIWGEQDIWQTPDWGQRLSDAIPNSVLHILPDCGHFSLEDQPERISDLIIAFLKG